MIGQAAAEAIDGTHPVTVNVDGIETVGDSSGELLTDGFDQYKHFLKNFVYQDYQSGNWLPTPMFTDEVLPKIDEPSFDRAKVAAAARITGGYVASWVLGANGELVPAREALARLNFSLDVDQYYNRRIQYAVTMEPATLTAADYETGIDDTEHILKDSFSVEDRLDLQFNVLPYACTRDFSGRTRSYSMQAGKVIEAEGGWLSHEEVRDASSITNYREEKRAQEAELWCIRSLPIAANIMAFKLRRSKHPMREATFEIPLEGFNYEIGDIVPVTHQEGVGANGWDAIPVRITRHNGDLNEYKTQLTGYDVSAYVV